MSEEDNIRDYEYKRGFLDGLTCFAWWKDGTQRVGTSSGMTLTEAKEKAEELWNYRSPKKENP